MDPLGDTDRLVGPAELGDVSARGEDPLASGHDDRAGRIGGEIVGDRVDGRHDRTRERVHLAVGERDDGDPVVTAFEQDHIVTHGCHDARTSRNQAKS